MYDGTAWENGTSIETQRKLSGATVGMGAQDFRYASCSLGWGGLPVQVAHELF